MEFLNSLLKQFGGLPPWAMVLLALLGFTSVGTLLFKIFPALSTSGGKLVFAIIIGVGLLVWLAIWLIIRMRAGKRAAALDSALRSSGGPTAGDVAEQNRIYREKFIEKLGKLREAGISVYKLPWFVVIGEPGSGKTYSLLHSGVNFPLGREEVAGFGGTRNYNWIFTDEAVILDTAGRLTFQEEGTTDRAEWEIFLKLLRNNRPRCPINGVVVVVPADKLLTETADMRATNAAILRERLRQIQMGLGIRFPTFLLITKMDKVPGFNEFFDEMRVDLGLRKQMLGWSRPGEFQTPYEPNEFKATFDDLHQRLRLWCMRYLTRKLTDRELGMIVTFPEALRDLREPLHEYVSSIFQKSPLIEPPFFRGFYFSSAVQEGAPISRIFRHMSDAAPRAYEERKAASMPFFLYDFYTRKVFPEQGLVFRSAKHASLNRRMRRTVFGGSLAVGLLTTMFFVFVWLNSSELIDRPSNACAAAVKEMEAAASQPAAKTSFAAELEVAKGLQKHFETYSASMAPLYAKMLWIGADVSKPRDAVRQIHAAYVLDRIGQPLLLAVEERLGNPPPPGDEKRAKYMKALVAYSSWFGAAAGANRDAAMAAGESKQRVVELSDMIDIVDQIPPADATEIKKQFEFAIEALAASGKAAYARDVFMSKKGFGADVKHAAGVLDTAVKKVADSWGPQADVSQSEFAQWKTLGQRVEQLRKRYEALLATAQVFPKSADGAAETVRRLTVGVDQLNVEKPEKIEPESLLDAMVEIRAYLKSNGDKLPQSAGKLLRFADLERLAQQKWEKDFSEIEKALAAGEKEVDRAKGDRAATYTAIDGARKSLADKLAASKATVVAALVADAKGADGAPVAEPLDELIRQGLFAEETSGAAGSSQRTAILRIADEAFGKGGVAVDYLKELRSRVMGGDVGEILADFRNWPAALAQTGSGEAASNTPLDVWMKAAPRERTDAALDKVVETSRLPRESFWRPLSLYDLATALNSAYREDMTKRVMDAMAVRVGESVDKPMGADKDGFLTYRGVGRLMKDYRDAAETLPFTWNKFASATLQTAAPAPTKQPDPAVEQPKKDDGGSGRLGSGRMGGGEAESKPTGDASALPDARRGVGPILTKYHTREQLVEALRVHQRLVAALQSDRLKDKSKPLVEALDKAADAYIDGYISDWFLLHERACLSLDPAVLTLIDDLSEGRLDWPKFVDRAQDRDLYLQTTKRLDAMLTHAALMPAILNGSDEIDRKIDARYGNREKVLKSLYFRYWQAVANPAALQKMNEELSRSWQSYTGDVKGVGELADLLGAEVKLPSVATLRDNFDKGKAALNSPQVAALMAIATHGQELLKYHIQTKLAERFKDVNGKYPVVELSGSDPLKRLEGLGEKPNIASPAEVLNAVRFAKRTRERYAKLWVPPTKSADDWVGDTACERTMDAGDKWARFLFATPKEIDRAENVPDRLVMRLVFSNLTGQNEAQFVNSLYLHVRAKLPILTKGGGTKVPPIELNAAPSTNPTSLQDRDVADAIGSNSAVEYALGLFGEQGYEPLSFAVYEPNPTASPQPPLDVSTPWSLPGSPWSLLMLLDLYRESRVENDKTTWRIPITIPIGGGKSVGFTVGVRIGTPDRAYPGPIPPLNPPPVSMLKMSGAEKYLKLN